MPQSDRICFLDFDHTLFDTDKFFHIDVRERFLALGIDITLWERTYEEVCLSGYTLEKHIETISASSGQQFPLQEMRGIIQNEFSNLEHYLFPDVVPFLQSFDETQAHLAILSFGNPEWQKYKIEASHIAQYFQFLFFTERGNSKRGVVADHVNTYRDIIVIDNHPQELDVIKDCNPNTRTFWMNRVPQKDSLKKLPRNSFLEAKKYMEMNPRHAHIRCASLREIVL